MGTLTWGDLPQHVITGIEEHAGRVKEAVPAAAVSGGLAAVLQTGDGRRHLVKAALEGTTAHTMYAREQAAYARLPGTVPAPPAQPIAVPGWTVLLLGIPDWRPASLAPGSPDIPRVTALLNELGHARADGLPPVAGHLAALQDRALKMLDRMPPGSDPDPGLHRLLTEGMDAAVLEGNRLVCCGLAAGGLAITSDGEAAVTSLARTCSAAEFVNAASVVPRLIEDGHAPGAAEEALSSVLYSFEAANEEPDTSDAITSLAVLWMCRLRYQSGFGKAAARESRARTADACRSWIAYRTGRA